MTALVRADVKILRVRRVRMRVRRVHMCCVKLDNEDTKGHDPRPPSGVHLSKSDDTQISATKVIAQVILCQGYYFHSFFSLRIVILLLNNNNNNIVSLCGVLGDHDPSSYNELLVSPQTRWFCKAIIPYQRSNFHSRCTQH